MKGNLFLGYGRGSVGDVVYSRVGGQQVGRGRNRHPKNPRTNAQMMQRSLFASPVKFYSKGVSKFFKFAFEDKKATESDYNAFMRHNIAAATRISKQASADPLYPAIGPWQMSAGSLFRPKLAYIGSESTPNAWRMDIPGLSSNVTTWAQLSVVLKTAFGLQEGDIMTIVHITAVGATVDNMPSIVPDSGLQGSIWDIQQFLIDSTDTTALPSIYIPDNGFIVFNLSDSSTNNYAQGFSVFFSRKTSKGLKVSNSVLSLNEVSEAIVEEAQTAIYEEKVLVDWQTEDEAILEGSVVKKK